MARQDIPIQQTTFRPDVITSGIHGNHDASSGILQDQRHQSHILPRRYFSPGKHTCVALPTQILCFEPTAPSGFQTKCEKVPVNTITAFSLPRLEVEHTGDASITPTYEIGRDSQNDRNDVDDAYGDSKGLHDSIGQNELCSDSFTVSTPTLPSTTILPAKSKRQYETVGSQMTLTEEARDSLRWWAPPLSNGRSLINHLPTHVITTDASMTGWGAQMNDMSIQGLWTDTEKMDHINFLELKTVLLALRRWYPHLKNKVVSLQMDNTTAVAYLLTEGGTQCRSLHCLAAEILILANHHRILIRPSYLPGLMNTQAVAFEGARRMDASSYSGSEDILDLRSTSSGPVCVGEKQTTATIFHDGQARPLCLGDRRFSPQLGLPGPTNICLPPPQPDSPGAGEGVSTQLPDDSDHSMVAEITMASRTDQIIGPIALSPAREIGFDPEPEDQPVVVRLPQVTHDGMAYFSSSLQVGGVEPEVAGFIQNAWKQSTKVQYFAVWKQWTA